MRTVVTEQLVISLRNMGNIGRRKIAFISLCAITTLAIGLTITMHRQSSLKFLQQPVLYAQNLFGSDNTGTARNLSIGSTGTVFVGKKMRRFQGTVKFSSFQPPPRGDFNLFRNDPWCRRWAVLTTIFEPTEAVRRQVRLRGWCLVVVADKKSPQTYETGWISGAGNEAVVYLDARKQRESKNEFVQAVRWNHFGRKNVGYVYAITHGAEVIWDFDDDNMLKFYIEGAAPYGRVLTLDEAIPPSNTESVKARLLHGHTHPTFNPYPALGAPYLPSWPRGLPLSDIKVADCSYAEFKVVEIKVGSLGVLQSLADYQPDVDAIYRLTMPNPFFFDRINEAKSIIIPRNVLTPYNGQATLHFKNSFWALLLPATVHGRVSDIWRSYIAQRLFWNTGLHLGFLPRPLVVQKRNVHNNIGDLNAEIDLYMKTDELIKFLLSWEGTGITLVGQIEQLWIDLYERNYIDIEDVHLVQLWIQTLLDVGYPFPSLTEKPDQASLKSKANEVSKNVLNDPANKDLSTGLTENASEICVKERSLTFWTSDLHKGCQVDTPTVLTNLGHRIIISGPTKGNPYPFVFKLKGITQYSRQSDVLSKKYRTHSTGLNERMIKDNFEFYKNDKMFESIDAFVCSFPSSMCEMWMPFNKTIVFLPAHRYNLGRCTNESWQRLNEHLNILASMSNPKHIIGAMSVYDEQYLEHYTGLKPLRLFSYSGFYTTNHQYAPKRLEILLVGHNLESYKLKLLKFKLVDVKKLYRHFELSDLVNHPAIVYIAYSVMSYKMTELYSLSIPIFVPSMKFYKSHNNFGPDRSSTSRFYCNNTNLNTAVKRHPASAHPYNPNIDADEDEESEYYWLQFSDFYQWPYVTYFDNSEDLENKLESVDFSRIHKGMLAKNEQRKMELLHNWCQATKVIETGRRVPDNYEQAIKKLYNYTQLQVH